jgi:hypothetical protein
MFTNTLLPRECFFTSPCFHDVRNPGAAAEFGARGIPAPGTKHRMLLEVTQL